MSRLSSGMHFSEAIVAMADGLPGSIVVLTRVYDTNPVFLVKIDELELYGSKLWFIYKDICKKDFNKFIRIICMCGANVLTKEELHSWTSRQSQFTEIRFEELQKEMDEKSKEAAQAMMELIGNIESKLKQKFNGHLDA